MENKNTDFAEEFFVVDDVPAKAPNDVFAYNEIRSCADLFRMFKDGVLDINPDFQRDVVWLPSDQTRFIDSILKCLPIPSMCFSYDANQQKWIVIDGLQRIYTIIHFLSGDDWTLSKLDDVDECISGKSAKDIMSDETYKEIRSKIENYSLPITIVRCDYNRPDHLVYLFTVFHRLNTGGVRLNNQEIRNCIYSGTLNNLLKELDRFTEWRQLNRMKEGENYRFTKQELILRFFAYREFLDNYKNSLSSFLNQFMQKYRYLNENDVKEWSEIFKRSVKVLNRRVYSIEKERLSMVVQDALLYGISQNIEFLESIDDKLLARKLDDVLNGDVFSQKNMSEGIARGNKVKERLAFVKDQLAR